MAYYIVKILLTTASIIAISEIAKRSSFFGALLASIPLISVLAMLWLYIETKDVSKISSLSMGVFWLVIPSLTLFLTLPVFLKQGWNFYISLTISMGLTVACYWLMITILSHFGVKL
ncbi:MAG: DUF3147 family protein [candidate division Zixibacteria bacterium]